MLHSFQSVQKHLCRENGTKENSQILRALDALQKQALVLFEKSDFITSKDGEYLFPFAGRAARQLLQKWVLQGFVISDTSKKNRKYTLNQKK